MDQSTKEQVITVLQQWVSRHPQPDTPAIQFEKSSHREGLSPKALLKEVEGNTPDGQFILAMIENAIAGNSLEAVLKSFSRAQASKVAAQARAQ